MACKWGVSRSVDYAMPNNLISPFKPKYRTNIIQAASISGCNKVVVGEMLPYHQINIIPDPLNQDKELMEIRFKDVTVTYVINDQDICCTGYLFLDEISDLERYLNVCDKCFKSVTLNSWKYKNCRIELKKEGPDFYFLFY